MTNKTYTYIILAIAVLGLYFQYRTMKSSGGDCGCKDASGKIIG